MRCASPGEWLAWLAKHHASSTGVWLRIAKKDGGQRSVTYAEAIEGALTWGWIDGQKNKLDDAHWLQRFSPRAARSPWSKINRDKATALLAAGKLAAPGLAEVERARRDGRWERAYDGARTSTVPADLAAALAANAQAAKFFATLDGSNRYAVLYRVQAPKLAVTRARKIAEYVAMLARGETIHPPKPPKKPKAKMK
ncbi:MAG TPA: YdeI/OmpD-associated family protein [Polyangia bacterium]|nr:YdeI/OmpD-associated family protein [Polyangia bacterium]